jgi:hypothetical protein
MRIVFVTCLFRQSGAYDGPPGLVNLIESITNFLRRLDIYIKIPPTAAMTEIVVKILVELLSTLAFLVKQTRDFIIERDEVEALLQRVDQLTQDEARTTAAQTFLAVYGLIQNMRVVMDGGRCFTFCLSNSWFSERLLDQNARHPQIVPGRH